MTEGNARGSAGIFWTYHPKHPAFSSSMLTGRNRERGLLSQSGTEFSKPTPNSPDLSLRRTDDWQPVCPVPDAENADATREAQTQNCHLQQANVINGDKVSEHLRGENQND